VQQVPRLVTSWPYDFSTGVGTNFYGLSDLAHRHGSPKGQDLIWSLLSLLDVAVSQQSLIYGDLTTKFVYDLAWNAQAHKPIDTPDPKNDTQLLATKLLRDQDNPWLGKNVLMMALDAALWRRDTVHDPSVPYRKTLALYEQIAAPDSKRMPCDCNCTRSPTTWPTSSVP
jgi:hypothetical protein